jgi:bifunctional DNA-binding transcriptional regulator/antitoxin component of YhaV-PrlF toxin-antitoxin module
MTVTEVKNKRLKISPGGLITLPVSARKALGMVKGQGARVAASVDGGEVLVSRKLPTEEEGWRISAGGALQLAGSARDVLTHSPTRHYWLKLSDDKQQVRLIPYR